MSESSAMRAPITNERLARELTELRSWIEFPATPDTSITVRARVVDRRPAPSKLSRFPDRRRPLLWTAAVVLLLAIVASVATPGVRHAIADAFGIPGIHIRFGDDETPASDPAPGLVNGELGGLVTFEDATELAGFKLALPAESTIGAPDEIYARSLAEGMQVVSFVYYPDSELPEAAETGMGALLMEFIGTADQIYFEKRIRTGGTVTETQVHGATAFWLEGTTELVMVDELSAFCCSPIGRLTANVLIWSENGVTYRLETALSFADAWVIAESVAPNAE